MDSCLAKKGHSLQHIGNLLRNIHQPPANQKIASPQREEYEFIDVSATVYCQAEGPYTKAFIASKKAMLVSKTLGNAEKLLHPGLFHRIYNATVINIGYVCRFLRTDGGYIVLKPGKAFCK